MLTFCVGMPHSNRRYPMLLIQLPSNALGRRNMTEKVFRYLPFTSSSCMEFLSPGFGLKLV